MPLGWALDPDDSYDGLSAGWADLGWPAVGSHGMCLHPHVFLLAVCWVAVILGDVSGASPGI